MGTSLLHTGDISQGRAHFDQALALYDPTEHRPLAARFGQDVRVSILTFRSVALWVLGYPEAALVDAKRALKDAREIGQVATLMYALSVVPATYCWRGDYVETNTLAEEAAALAEEKGILFWKGLGMLHRGSVMALTGKASDAAQMITTGSQRGGPQEQQCGCRYLFHFWRSCMQSLANSRILGAASAKR